MRAKQFPLSAYTLNHPSGAIGKKMTLTVEDVMIKDIPLARPEDLLIDVLVELSNKKCGALLVADSNSQLLGVFTDGDLRRALQSHGSDVLNQPIKDLMTLRPSVVAKDTLAWDALLLMQRDPKRFIMMLPVVEEGRVVGILRMHDIITSSTVSVIFFADST